MGHLQRDERSEQKPKYNSPEAADRFCSMRLSKAGSMLRKICPKKSLEQAKEDSDSGSANVALAFVPISAEEEKE